MIEVKKVTPISDYSPNVIAVVNAPRLSIPTRGYIFRNGINETFGSLKNAVDYFLQRMSKIPNLSEVFQVGCIFGNNPPDKDIFVYPFTYSGNNSDKIRSNPYIIKNDVHMSWSIREKLDEFANILDDEQLNLRSRGLECHITNFPRLTRLQYVEN